MNKNEIDCAIEDAWKEFERGGEISNSADNLLSAVTELKSQRDQLAKAFDLIISNRIRSELCNCEGIDIQALLDKTGIKA